MAPRLASHSQGPHEGISKQQNGQAPCLRLRGSGGIEVQDKRARDRSASLVKVAAGLKGSRMSRYSPRNRGLSCDFPTYASSSGKWDQSMDIELLNLEKVLGLTRTRALRFESCYKGKSGCGSCMYFLRAIVNGTPKMVPGGPNKNPQIMSASVISRRLMCKPFFISLG